MHIFMVGTYMCMFVENPLETADFSQTLLLFRTFQVK